MKSVYESGTAAHAYLFFGPEHIGKLAIAKEWVKFFFPEENAALIDRGAHPDVLYLSRERLLVTENQKEIGIDDVREVRRRIALRPNSGAHFFVIIDGAEDLSEEAQNSFLKVLEEPPSYARCILITDSPERLLPTVVSRTVPMEFAFVSDTEISAYLSDRRVSSDEREKILMVSFGRPGIAARMCEDKEFYKKESGEYESFARAAHADMIDQFLWSQKMSQDADAIEKFFFFLLVECRKRLLAEPARAEALSAREILRLLDMMRETNVNRRLLLDNVFLSLSR